MKRKCFLWILCVSFLIMTVGCSPSVSAQKKGKEYYTKYNFHYTAEKGRMRGSIANFTKPPLHKVLPYNSKVVIKSGGSGFVMVEQVTGVEIDVIAKGSLLKGMSLNTYLDLILSPTPVNYPDLSEVDQKGIKEGMPIVGMSKKGVMIALGYPSPHRTASPDSGIWQYWKNRFDHYSVSFENDKVVSHGY